MRSYSGCHSYTICKRSKNNMLCEKHLDIIRIKHMMMIHNFHLFVCLQSLCRFDNVKAKTYVTCLHTSHCWSEIVLYVVIVKQHPPSPPSLFVHNSNILHSKKKHAYHFPSHKSESKKILRDQICVRYLLNICTILLYSSLKCDYVKL